MNLTVDFGIIIASTLAILGLVVLLVLEMIKPLDQYIEQWKYKKCSPGTNLINWKSLLIIT